MTNESMFRQGRQPAAGKRVKATALLAIGGAMLIAGCSSSSSTTTGSVNAQHSPPKPTGSAMSHSPATSPSPAASQKIPCKEADQLRTSLTSLSHTKVSASSAGTLTTDLKNVQTDVAALKSKATGPFASDLNALSASVANIKKAAAGLSTNPTAAMKSLVTNIADLKTKAAPVIADINASCPKKT
jgi:hypothetical protein